MWDTDEVLVESRRCESVIFILKYFDNRLADPLQVHIEQQEKGKFGFTGLLLQWEWAQDLGCYGEQKKVTKMKLS